MRFRLWLGLFVCGLPLQAFAQQVCTPAPPFTSPPPTAFTCYAGLPFKVAFDASSPQAGDVYKVRVDGVQVGPDVPATAGATAVVLTVSGLATRATAYAIAVGHVRAPSPESVSAPLSLTLIPVPPPPPGPPGNMRIIAELVDDSGRVLARYVLLERPVAQ